MKLRELFGAGIFVFALSVCLCAGTVRADADELWTATDSLPAGTEANDGKTFVLQDDVTISAPANYGSKVSGSGIIIDLNGHTVTSTGVASGTGVFIVTNGGKLTVTDSSEAQTGTLKGPDTQNRVVYLYGNAPGTAFTLAGGSISGNTARSGIVSSATSSAQLSGVTFNMTGGSITGNTITDPTGIVYLNREGDVFNKTGGVVSGNSFPEGGAEIVVYSAPEEEFLPWTDPDSLPSAGRYYLDCEVTVSARTRLTADLELDLNGHTIKAGSGSFFGVLGISANNDYKLRIFNEKAAGGLDGNGLTRSGFLIGSVANARGQILLEGVSISNMGGSASGPCICLQGHTSLSMKDCTVSGVSCSGDGAALYVTSDGNISIDGCTISGCSAGSRGGALFLNGTGSTLIKDSVITGNSAAAAGAGVGLYKGSLALSGTVTIRDNSVSGTASDLFYGPSVSVDFSELAGGSRIGLSYAETYTDGTTVAAGLSEEQSGYLFGDDLPADGYLRYYPGSSSLIFRIVPSGRIDSVRVEVARDLTVYFYGAFKKALADDIVLEVSRGGEVSRLTGSYQENGESYGMYSFAYQGVLAQCMTDPVSARLIYTEGGEETVLDTLSGWTVAGYADQLHSLYPGQTKIGTLLADLLEYGAAAQIHALWRTGDAANAPDWVAAEKTQVYTGAGSVREFTPSSDTARYFTGASLRLGSGVALRISFAAASADGLEIAASFRGERTGRVSASELEHNGGKYYFCTDDIAPADFGGAWTFELLDGGSVIQTLTYSVDSYLAAKQDGTDADAALVRAISNYASSASAYLDSLRVTHDLTATEFHVGEGCEWTSFTQCLIDLQGIETEKTIYIHEGTYDIFREYRIARVTRPAEDFPRANTADYMPYNVIVPPNTHIIGVGNVVLRYAPDPEETYAAESWLVSPLNISGTATVENLEIRCRNGRYTIHDETLGIEKYSGSAKTYINVRSYKEKNDTGLGFSSGIGFGFDDRMTFTFTDCEFYNDNAARPFYMHSRKASKEGRIYTEADSSTITLNGCTIDARSASSTAAFFGNATGVSSDQHIIVTMNGCRIRGIIKTANEADNSLGTNSNRYDFRLNSCTSVAFSILDPNNSFTPVITDEQAAWE